MVSCSLPIQPVTTHSPQRQLASPNKLTDIFPSSSLPLPASPHFTINAANGGGNGRSNSDDTQSRTILENEISDFMLGRDI